VARFEDSAALDAPADAVAQVLLDITTWPTWTPTITEVQALDGAALEPGRRYRVRQPRLPRALWVVDEVEPGRSFTWHSQAPGVLTRAQHVVTATSDTTSTVRLVLTQSGPLAGVVALVYGRLTRGFLATELRTLAERLQQPA
jgi:uncharacterized membrane protein